MGLTFEVKLSDSVVVPGQKLVVRLFLHNGSTRAFPVVLSAPERLPSPEKNPAYTDSDATAVGTGVNVPDPNRPTELFEGSLDELLIYGRALRREEIAGLASGAEPRLGI